MEFSFLENFHTKWREILVIGKTIEHNKKTGTHNLPLKSCTIQTPVLPDTYKILTELFFYFEKKG